MYWYLPNDDMLYGPLRITEDLKDPKETIKNKIGVEPCTMIHLYYSSSRKTMISINNAKYELSEYSEYKKFKEDKEKTSDKAKILVRKLLNTVKYEITSINSNNIIPKIGNNIYAEMHYLSPQILNIELCSCSKSKNKIYNILSQRDAKNFTEEINKRLKDRYNRALSSKSIASRTEKIGSYDGSDCIVKAEFSIYYDAEQEIHEATPHLVGSVKFNKKAPINCIFDLNKRKIYRISNNKEITADNVEKILQQLEKCLADIN